MVPTPRAARLAVPVQRALEQLEQSLTPPQPFEPSRSTQRFTLSLEDAGQVGLLPLLAERLKTTPPYRSLVRADPPEVGNSIRGEAVRE